MRLPGLPDECAIERAEHPERIWDVAWEPCTDAAGGIVEGCLTTPTLDSGIVGAWNDGGEVWLRMIAGDALGEGRIIGIARRDGPAVAAWREPPVSIEDDGINCNVTAWSVGGGRAAFVAQYTSWRNMTLSRAWLYVATPETIGAATTPIHEFPASFVPHDRTIAEIWISAELLALQASPDGSLYSFRDGEWATLTGRGTVEGLPQNVAVIGDHLFWEAWRHLDDVRLVHAAWGEPASVWRDVLPGVTKSFGTDGQDLAWLEGHDRNEDGSYQRLELWTAPYEDDVAGLEPRLVREIPVRVGAAVGGGWYAMRRTTEGPQRVQVFSLLDGSARAFVPPGGYVLDQPYYASEREIMFQGAGTQAVRFDPTSLPIEP